MKKVLRSAIVILLALVVSSTSAAAYFTSNVPVNNNLITTGELRLAIDTTAFGGGNSGYVAAYDNDGVITQLASFPTITNMLPGSGQTRSVYFTMRNIGTVPFDYRGYLSGTWGDSDLDDQNVMSISQITRYTANDCQADVECEDIYFWLTGAGFTHVGPLFNFGSLGVVDADGSSFFGHANAVSDGVNTLLPNQFAIFKADFVMSNTAGNDFQGQTFTYSMNGAAKQTNAPAFAP